MISLSTRFTPASRVIDTYEAALAGEPAGRGDESVHVPPPGQRTSRMPRRRGDRGILHVYLANRGILMTRLNMALMSPRRRRRVDAHSKVFNEAVASLAG